MEVGRVCPHIAQVAFEVWGRGDAIVFVRIDAAIKSSYHRGAIVVLQLGQDFSSGEREHQVELGELPSVEILDFAVAELSERDRRIQVIKNAQRPPEVQDFIIDAAAFGQEAGGNQYI